MKKLLCIVALALPLAACGEDDARRAIEAHGFTNVTLGSSPWFGCAESDSAFYNKTFTATGVNGKPVAGIACGGAFKGWTIRLH